MNRPQQRNYLQMGYTNRILGSNLALLPLTISKALTMRCPAGQRFHEMEAAGAYCFRNPRQGVLLVSPPRIDSLKDTYQSHSQKPQMLDVMGYSNYEQCGRKWP